jgi:predicted RNA-binding protein associated with RNAse of E/G family
MSEITIVKRSHKGEFLIEYSGEVVARGETWVCVRARFEHDDKVKEYVVFRRGDTFYEWHYADRWYNVFEMHDVSDGHLKGWYCNVTRPALITDSRVVADDLALDAFISPDGDMLVLDEDEFAALDLSTDERRLALMAIEEIRGMVERKEQPFGEVMSKDAP